MAEKKIPVITINREYGAGGRSLAEILSDKLGIPYYDREFVSKTVEESGYDVEDVEREGEEMSRPSKVLNNILNSTVSYSSSHDAIFSAEKKVILELADKPCIMVGRCADYILGQAGIDTVSVLNSGRAKQGSFPKSSWRNVTNSVKLFTSNIPEGKYSMRQTTLSVLT